jgi:hypothetical protein
LLIVPLLTVVVGACAPASGQDLPSSTVTTSSQGVATSSAQATTTTAPSSTTTTSQVDAATMLGDSLSATSQNYRFSSVVLVGEDTLTTIDGVVDGQEVAAEVSTGTGSVSYVRTTEGEWVTDSEGAWVALEGEPPVSAPLSALTDAGNLMVVSSDGVNGLFTGTLGPGSGEAEGLAFSVTIEQGLISEIRYQVENGGQTAQVITTFTEVGAAGSVSPPAGV